MASFIIIAPNPQLQEDKVVEFCNKLNINPLDRIFIKSDKQNSIGIELVRILQKKIFLKPLKGSDKAVIIQQAELLTVPAQNALLKLLEEPPAHTFIFLLAQSMESLLPTIISRCQIIKNDINTHFISRDESKELLEQLSCWMKLSIAGALKQAEALAKDKDKTLAYLEKIIIVGEKQLIADIYSSNPTINIDQIRHLQQTHTLLKTTNANLRLTLEHLLLSFIKSS